MALTMNEAINRLQTLRGKVPPIFHPAIDLAIDTMRQADRYRWHDLMENPSDLPKPREEDDPEEYLCIFSGRRRNVRYDHAVGMMEYWGDGEWEPDSPYFIEGLKVHAWREIDVPDMAAEEVEA